LEAPQKNHKKPQQKKKNDQEGASSQASGLNKFKAELNICSAE
jgi:hypothetical protein